MKTDNKQSKNHLPEKLTAAQAAGKKYQLRAECRYDSSIVRAALRPWLLSWKIAPNQLENESHIDANGVLWCSQDWDCGTEVQFIIGQGGPTLGEIRWILMRLMDCDIAAETLNTAEEYTGERLDFDDSNLFVSCPERSRVNEALSSLAHFKETSEMIAKSTSESWQDLEDSRPTALTPPWD